MDAVGATRRGRAQCEKEEKVQYESAPSFPNLDETHGVSD